MLNRLLVLLVTYLVAWTAAWAAVETPSAVPAAYRVGVGDELNFRFTYVPELNTQATVRSDGRVSLPLVGEIEVSGLSLEELTALVEQRMQAQLRRPQVVINVQGGAVRRVFVGGEVVRPSMQPLNGPLTVLEAVMMAEGLRDSAQPAATLVLRRTPDGHGSVLKVDLEALMDGGTAAQDVLLQPYDVIIVPRSGIASLGRWVDQYIRRVLPFSLGFSYTVTESGVIVK